MKFKVIFLVLVMIFLLTGLSSVYSQTSNSKTYRDYYVLGERRAYLAVTPWGGIFYLPDRMGNVKYENTTPSGSYRITTPQGEVLIDESVGGAYEITYPGGHAKVEQSLNDTTVTFNGSTYRFSTAMDELTVVIPSDEIRYKTSLNNLLIEGRQGKVTYDQQLDEYTVTSNAGKTLYKNEIGGFKFEGVPAASHPYRYWCVEFTIPGSYLGFMIDLRNLFPLSQYVEAFKWDQALLVR